MNFSDNFEEPHTLIYSEDTLSLLGFNALLNLPSIRAETPDELIHMVCKHTNQIVIVVSYPQQLSAVAIALTQVRLMFPTIRQNIFVDEGITFRPLKNTAIQKLKSPLEVLDVTLNKKRKKNSSHQYLQSMNFPELRIMTHLSEGKTPNQISMITGYDVKKVSYYKRRICDRFSLQSPVEVYAFYALLKNTREAVNRAI
jgi:DNA-binding CsgD family transcriptional regulator